LSLQLPNEAQLALTRGVADFLAGQYSLDRFRSSQLADSERFGELAGIGMLGISLPEANGGLGLQWLDEVLACREAGRLLVSPALLGSVVGVHVCARAGLAQLCQQLLAGERSAGIAMLRNAGEIRVLDGGDGLVLLVDPQRVRLLELASGKSQELSCIDESVKLSAAQLPGQEVASTENPELVLAAHLLAAAMLCGLLEAARDMAAEYARTRVQFGRPIGAFQAIKHRCADAALAAELCWSQLLYATQALQSGAADAEFHVLAAKLLAGDEALKAARFNIQAHGGMGFTDEVHAHRLLKRAHVLHQLFTDPRHVRSQLLDLTLEL
jgi:alkylation response protein AidB-like acyl-CoA dehydrogenase